MPSDLRNRHPGEMRRLGTTELRIAPLVLGGNVFGWTADRATSFAILDAFLAAGFNTIDTADVYNRYAPGLEGGESESLIGAWMKDRQVRNQIVLITKGGLAMGGGREGLGRDYLPRACDASLERLQTDHIDVYMSHRADPEVPVEDTLATFRSLIDAGKVRYAGCSNYTAAELAGALAASRGGLPRYEVIEPLYNLVDRDTYEGAYEELCAGQHLGVVTYYSLASGFLTGKYRRLDEVAGRPRAHTLTRYFNGRGNAVLAALDTVAARHDARPSQVALAWLMARPSVTAPIASATSVAQLQEILGAATLTLSPADLADLECRA